jgi:hypothetical protein
MSYHSSYMTSWERQNYGDSKIASVASIQEFGIDKWITEDY